MDYETYYTNAFAYHKIITDTEGKPIDYEFIEVNKAFERLTSLNRDDILGKRIKKIVPTIVDDKFDWVAFYGKVALTGNPATIEQYSETFKRWYSVDASSPEKGYFATLFIDITSLKQRELKMIDNNELLNQLYEELTASEEELRQHVDELEHNAKLLVESEGRLNRAQALSHVGNWEIDINTKMVWASDEAFKIYGLTKVPILPLEIVQKLVHIEDRFRMDKAFELLIEGKADYNMTFRIIKADTAAIRYIHTVAEMEYNDYGKPVKVLGVIQDITEKVIYESELKNRNAGLTKLYEELMASEEELRQQFDEIQSNKELIALSEERYKTLVNSSYDLIYSCDCNGTFTTVSDKFVEVVRLPIDKIIGKSINDILKGIDSENWNKVFSRVIKSGKPMAFDNKYEFENGDIKYHNVTLSPIFDIQRRLIGVTGTHHDITIVKQNEQTIMHMAYHDYLTDLPNRILFLDRLKNAITLSNENGNKTIVALFDLDNFKKINDTLGHAIGDKLLIETSKRILKCLDAQDTLARLSGDEFSVLLENVEQRDRILTLLKKIILVFEEPFIINNNVINVTTSIGVSIYPDDGATVEDLLINADTAMSKAKDYGKNGYQFYQKIMKSELLRKMNIERMLRRAIINNEFTLHYQPQYSVKTGKLRGFEALIRWENPELGLLNPMEFISIAEETGLIIPIGEWALNTAILACRRAEKEYGCNLIMSVNISPIQFKQHEFYKAVLKAIDVAGIKPSSIELEITENIFIDNDDSIINLLTQIRTLGVGIALDDFGTGYSSLSYLRKLPINLLKIDKAFIQEINSLNPQNELTESIISLVHKLDIETVAEGIETFDQLNYLINAKCDYLQGYLLGKPGPEDLMDDIIKKGLFAEQSNNKSVLIHPQTYTF